MGESGLNRLLQNCKSTLKFLSLPYTNACVNELTLSTVGRMKNLESLYLGRPYDNLGISPKFNALNRMFQEMNLKKIIQESKLRNLSLYHCDIKIFE